MQSTVFIEQYVGCYVDLASVSGVMCRLSVLVDCCLLCSASSSG